MAFEIATHANYKTSTKLAMACRSYYRDARFTNLRNHHRALWEIRKEICKRVLPYHPFCSLPYRERMMAKYHVVYVISNPRKTYVQTPLALYGRIIKECVVYLIDERMIKRLYGPIMCIGILKRRKLFKKNEEFDDLHDCSWL